MKNRKMIKMLAICLIFISACVQSSIYSQQGQNRNLDPFNELNLSISGEVYLKQGPTQKVEIQASDKVLKLIETEVRGSKLTIKWSQMFVHTSENIKIYITMVDVKSLRVSGSGDIFTEGTISTNDIDLAVSGSGNINIKDLKAENISSSISGSADISIEGTNQASKLDASISGSGNIKAQDLPVKNVEVSISGSGNCSVNAIESLQARVSGSGDVFYKGNATIDGKVSGSGSIKHIN